MVDQDSGVREIFDSELPSEAFDVVVTESAEESLGLASQRQFDVVFMELARSTLDTFKQVRKSNSTVPVVILSDSSDGKLVGQAMEIGVFTLARKPTSGTDVRNLLQLLSLSNGQLDN